MFFNRFFGQDKSAEFISLLPQFSKKILVVSVLKLAVFSFILSVAFGGVFLLILNYLKVNTDDYTKILIFMVFIYLFTTLFSIKCFYKPFKVLKTQLLSLPIKTVFRHSLILVFAMFLLSYLASLIEFIKSPNDIKPILSHFSESEEVVSISYITIIFFPLLWALVGIAEELFFRGGIYRGLRVYFSKNISLITMALFFMLFHPMSITNSISIFVFAVIYGYYFEYKNNILVLIVVHMFQDLLVAGFSAYLAALTVNLFIN